MLPIKSNKLEFKKLSLKDFASISQFINDNYIEESEFEIRINYSVDFIYWYLSTMKNGIVLALIFNANIIGLITARIIDMMVHRKASPIAYIDFWCTKKKMRRNGIGAMLFKELISQLDTLGYRAHIIKSNRVIAIEGARSYTCTIKNYIIPINHNLLYDIGLLDEINDDFKSEIDPDENPLHLMQDLDIDSIVTKLQEKFEQYAIYPMLSGENIQNFLCNKKFVSYCFVNRDEHGRVTDFVCTNYFQVKDLHTQCIINTVKILFYFCTKLDLTMMIKYLIDKLSRYGIDQLLYDETCENECINITKLPTIETMLVLNGIYIDAATLPLSCFFII